MCKITALIQTPVIDWNLTSQVQHQCLYFQSHSIAIDIGHSLCIMSFLDYKSLSNDSLVHEFLNVSRVDTFCKSLSYYATLLHFNICLSISNNNNVNCMCQMKPKLLFNILNDQMQ